MILLLSEEESRTAMSTITKSSRKYRFDHEVSVLKKSLPFPTDGGHTLLHRTIAVDLNPHLRQFVRENIVPDELTQFPQVVEFYLSKILRLLRDHPSVSLVGILKMTWPPSYGGIHDEKDEHSDIDQDIADSGLPLDFEEALRKDKIKYHQNAFYSEEEEHWDNEEYKRKYISDMFNVIRKLGK